MPDDESPNPQVRPRTQRDTVRQKEYYAENREAIRERQRAYYLANKARMREQAKAYYEANKGRIIEQQKLYKKSDPARTARRDADYRARSRERQQAREAQRRSRERETPEPVLRSEVQAKVALFDGRCAYCGDPWQEMDHVLSLARGGRHEIGNMVPACRPCNRSKGARIYPFEWSGRNG